MQKFESFGRDKVKFIYAAYVKAEMYFWSQELKDAGVPQYVKEMTDKNYERQVKEWKKENLQTMTDSELLKKLNDLRKVHPQY